MNKGLQEYFRNTRFSVRLLAKELKVSPATVNRIKYDKTSISHSLSPERVKKALNSLVKKEQRLVDNIEIE